VGFAVKTFPRITETKPVLSYIQQSLLWQYKRQGGRTVVQAEIPVKDHQRALLKRTLREKGAGGDKMQQQPFCV